MPRRRSVRGLAGSSAFVATGPVYLISSGGHALWAWLAVLFFGLGALVFAVEMARPSTLTLTPDGFTERPARSSRRQWSRSWDECGAFIPAHIGTELVTYVMAGTDRARLRSLNQQLTAGADEAVRAGYGSPSAVELAALMNAYRGAGTLELTTAAIESHPEPGYKRLVVASSGWPSK